VKVFVTGATGFVTGTVTLQLLARGDEVLGRGEGRSKKAAEQAAAAEALERWGR